MEMVGNNNLTSLLNSSNNRYNLKQEVISLNNKNNKVKLLMLMYSYLLTLVKIIIKININTNINLTKINNNLQTNSVNKTNFNSPPNNKINI